MEDHLASIGMIVGAVVAVGAILVPAVRFIRSNIFPRSIVFIGHDGKELGEISAARVQEVDLEDLERLHDRVRREKHVRIRSVA